MVDKIRRTKPQQDYNPRIDASFDAETLEATLRRVVRDEIGKTVRAILEGADDYDFSGDMRAVVEASISPGIKGIVTDYPGILPDLSNALADCPDALAVMAYVNAYINSEQP